MKATRYQVTSVDLSLDNPDLSDIEDGAVKVDFQAGSEPEYDDELDALVGAATLNIDLYSHDGMGRPPQGTIGDPDAKLGDISVTFRIILEGNSDTLTTIVTTWQENGYTALDSDTRFHLESGIGTEIMNPLSDLIDSSFRGLLPHTRFTQGTLDESDNSE